jgi:hypothetical protein
MTQRVEARGAASVLAQTRIVQAQTIVCWHFGK